MDGKFNRSTIIWARSNAISGASVGVNEDLAVYGELSGATNGEDASGDTVRDYGAKIGAKFVF